MSENPRSYGNVIKLAVHKKWPAPEQKEWWYTKLTAARRRKLEKLHARQEGRCFYCERDTWLKAPNINMMPTQAAYKLMATLEHKKPQSQGGTDGMNNLVMACGYCNGMRGTLPFEYFNEVRRDPLKWKAHTTKTARVLQKNDRDRAERSRARRVRLIWNIAILFYLHTNYG